MSDTVDYEMEVLAPPTGMQEMFEAEWNRIASSFGAFPYILKGVNGKWIMTAAFPEDDLESFARFAKFWQDLGFHLSSGHCKKPSN